MSPGSAPGIALSATVATGTYRVQINKLPASPNLKRGATTLGKMQPMILVRPSSLPATKRIHPVSGTTRKEYAADPHGQDWYRFRFDSDVPKLVYFQLELTDRDDLPATSRYFACRTEPR